MSIMSNDQRDISATLRFMDPQTLRQYGEMHKENPYIFPLVFQESQNRQRLNMNQQMQMAGQQQPKVNEQALAQMAPPRAQPMPQGRGQGIADLDAPNMQFAADGGILGYPDDANFAERSEPVVMMSGGGHVPRYQGNPQDGSVVRARGPYGQPPSSMTGEIPGFVAGTSIFQTQPSVDPEEPFFRRMAREYQESIDAKRVQEARVRAAKGQPLSAEDQARIAKADTAKTAADTSAQDLAQFDAASNLYMTERAAKQAAAKPAPKADAAPKVDTTRRNTTDPTAVPKEPVASEQTAAQRYAAMQKGLEPERAEIDKGIAALAASKRKTVADELSEFEKDVAERGVAFKGREERTAKKEAELGKRKDELGSFAMLEFGLGLMAEPGSFAKAVGRVGQTTAKNYSAGLKDLRAAQEKLDDARDQIEEFRRTEANMTSKERRQFKSAIGRTENEIEQLGLNAAEKMYGNKREDAKTIFTADTQERLTRMEIGSRERISRNEISARERIAQIPQGQERIASLLGGGDIEKGLVRFAEIQAGKFNPTTAYTEYLSKRKEGDSVLTPQQFVTQIKSIQALMGKTPPAAVDTSKPDRQ